jgi:predicted metalloprotease with PDZ domain
MNEKLILGAFTLALGCILVCPVVASDYKCTATTQECLDSMVAHYKQKGWIGVNLERDESSKGMEITSVVPDGPASKAGFRAGDRMTAMNGIKFAPENEEKLAEVQKSFKPGARFTFTILRDGKEMKIVLTLGRFPDDIIANAIGPHMLEHVTPEPEKGEKTAKREGS